MHGMIQQVARGAGNLRPEFQRRLARWLVDEVAPILDAHERAQAEAAEPAPLNHVPVFAQLKRGPGRPRKAQPEASA